MSTPTAPGSSIGQTATAGEYTWSWNGYAWDLVTTTAGGAYVTVGWNLIANTMTPVVLDYL
jgi:hypothetical protein